MLQRYLSGARVFLVQLLDVRVLHQVRVALARVVLVQAVVRGRGKLIYLGLERANLLDE